MNRLGRFILLLILAFFLAGCAPEPNDDYNPTEGSPTHERMFEEFFGVQKDHNTFVEIFTYSKPPMLLGFGLDILWFMAVFAFIVIMVVGGIKSTLQAPTSQSLLGNDISTPLAPVRIGLTAFFLLTLGSGHYSVIESLILSANKYVSTQANKLYTSQVENYRDEYISVPTPDNNPGVKVGYSQNDYYKVFRTAMCNQYIVDAELSNKASKQRIMEKDNLSGDGAGTFMYAVGERYNLVIEDGGWFWFDAPVDGGCGQWYLYTEPPASIKIGSTVLGFEIGYPEGNLNQTISKELEGAVAASYVTTRLAWGEFSSLANKMISYKKDGVSYEGCGTDANAPYTCEQYFSNEFYRLVDMYNARINNAVNGHYNRVISSPYIGDINDDAIDTARNHGWFFAGALPYMFASSAERLNVFENITLNASPPQPDLFPKAHQKKLKEYFAYSEQVVGLSSNVNNAALLPRDNVGASFGGTYMSCLGLDPLNVLDCVGAGVSMETLSLTRMLALGVSHPLTAIHRVGKSGANSTLNAMIGLNALQGSALVGSSALVGAIPFWGTSLFSAVSTIIQTTVSMVMPFLEYLNISYVVLGFFVVLMPFIYFSVAIVSYIITLFVGVLAANFFAVSHAWLEGQGVVSSYAQRGYPSLIFSALTPILVILVFFIYLYTMPFVFQFLGYAYNLFLMPFMSSSLPGVYGGMFFFIMLVVLMIAIHRAWARLLLTIPDRVMRLIGVHEALTQNDFSGEVDRGGQEGAGTLGKSSAVAAGGTGQMIAGNAGSGHQSVLPDGGQDQDGATDPGDSGDRDTSGYNPAGGQYRANPRHTGLGHIAASAATARMQNDSQEGGESSLGGGAPSGGASSGGPTSPSGSSSSDGNGGVNFDADMRQEADSGGVQNNSGRSGESELNHNAHDGHEVQNDADDGSGKDSVDSEERENEMRKQASVDNEKVSSSSGAAIRESDDSNDSSDDSNDGYNEHENLMRDEADSQDLDDSGHHDESDDKS